MTKPLALRDTIADFIVHAPRVTDDLSQWLAALLFDYAVVTEAGSVLDSSRAARASITCSPGKKPGFSSGIVGTNDFARPDDAALVNGIAGHGLELDDTYEPSSLHPGVVVFSAVLAESAELELPWGDIARAAAVGYDVMCQVGSYVGSAETYSRGFHPTGVAGAWGSAAAVAALHRLSEEQTAAALSLAANMAAGSLEFLGDGSWTKRLNAGHAAAVGLRAVALAKNGFTGPEGALEGRHGFARLYGNGPVPGRELALSFGESAKNTSIKFFPCCRYMHGAMDLLSEYRRREESFDLNDIERIQVGVITAGRTLVADPPENKIVINTAVDAQFSMPFGAIASLALPSVTTESFTRAPQLADEWQDHLAKVECVSRDDLDQAYPKRWAAFATLHLANGETVELSETAFVGAPENPATSDQLFNKAAGLVGEHRARNIKTQIERAQESEVFPLAW